MKGICITETSVSQKQLELFVMCGIELVIAYALWYL